MKKLLTGILAYLFVLTYGFAATEFNMTFSTAAPGGGYNPKNVVAVWVTQTNGTFVKTILRYAGGHKDALTTWTAAAGSSDADAVLGATRSSHSATLTATWDLKNKAGTVVPDGIYRINLECADGSRKAYSFNFVKDSTGGTRTDLGNANFKNISITYAPPGPPNTAPVAHAQSVTNAEDTAKAITLTATDAETNALTYAIVTGPAHGTLSGIAPSVTYTPTLNYFGADSFTFKANDGKVDSASATVSITVTPVNDAPVAKSQNVSVATDVAKAITLVATDVETNALTYTVVTGPAQGTLSGAAPNLTYTPATNYAGPDSFTFKANDGAVDSVPATVSITVAINVAPVADSQSVSTVKNAAKAIALTATDAETNALTYAIVAGPAHGALSGTAPNITYTPATNYTGPDSFTFSAFDGISTGNVATVSITVTDIQYALTISSGSGSGSYTNGARVTIAANSPVVGKVFDRWIGSTQYVTSVTSSTTTVTMPAKAATLTATYKTAYYTLTVNGGTGGGSYTNGQRVTIKATVPSGWVFSRWTGGTQYVAGVTSLTAIVTMPTNAVVCAASFKDILKPVLTVSSPKTGLRLTNALVKVIGKATDNSGAADVLVRLNGGDWQTNNVLLRTTNWTANLTLQPGTNVVRTCARDAAGNISITNTLNLTYVLYGSLNIQTNGPGTVTRTPTGEPEVGKSYTLTAVPPKTGGKFSRWSGDSSSTNKTVTFIMTSNKTFIANFTDTLNPTVVVTYPTASMRVMTNGTVVLRGTAADNGRLNEVRYQLRTGEWTNAVSTNVWKNWTANFYPEIGLNTARVYSVDVQGNVSATSAVVFTYAPGAVMTVQTSGAGTITPAYNGKVLEIGKSYMMTAKAVSGFVFTNWTYGIGGTVATNKTIVTFVMQSNLVLTANFRSLSAKVALASVAVVATATPQAAIVVDGSSKDWLNVPRSSFSYASVTQEVAAALDGNNIVLLLNGCPFNTSDNVLVYFKLRLTYGSGDNLHTVDLWTSGAVLYGMVDGQVIAGLEAVLLDGVLEVKLPVDLVPSQVTIEEVGCGIDLGDGTLTELFKRTLP